jgi:hypothetical protein
MIAYNLVHKCCYHLVRGFLFLKFDKKVVYDIVVNIRCVIILWYN